MLNRTQKLIVAAAVALLWPGTTRGENDRLTFYDGPAVSISRVSGKIYLQRDEAPTAKLQVEIQNASGKPLDRVSVNFRGADADDRGENFSLGRKETQTLTRTPSIDFVKDPSGVRQARLDLVLEIKGMLPRIPIVDTDILILLPPGVPALIRSNMQLTTPPPDEPGLGRKRTGRGKLPPIHKPRVGRPSYAEEEALPEPGMVEGRAAYRLVQTRTYPTELNLIYDAASVTLSVKKSVTPTPIKPNQVETVTLQVCNRGPDPATDVELRDSFDPRDFAPYTGTGAAGTFQNYAGPENDRRLLWSFTIPGVLPLCSSKSVTVVYYVTSNVAVSNTWLNAVTATMGGKLVGVSNKIQLGP